MEKASKDPTSISITVQHILTPKFKIFSTKPLMTITRIKVPFQDKIASSQNSK